MKTMLLVAALLVASVGARAEGAAGKYWVVGSFNRLTDAKVERVRLQKTLGDNVRIASFDVAGGTLYRLVVAESDEPSAQKSHLQSAGVSPWLVASGESGLSFVSADNDTMIEYRLVVGSFAREANAQKLVDKMKAQGFAMVNIATGQATGQSRYRVALGPYEKRFTAVKDKAEDSGISDAWWMAVAVKGAEPKQEEASSKPPSQVTPPTNQSSGEAGSSEEQSITPPAAGESLVVYCGKANTRERARYCTSKDLLGPLYRQMVVNGVHGKMYVDYCAKFASTADYKKFCNPRRFAKQAFE